MGWKSIKSFCYRGDGVCFVYYEDRSPVGDALIKVYDSNREYLCERKSDSTLFGYNIITDSLISSYGIYYVEVSKPGYKTVEVKTNVQLTDMQYVPEVVLKPGNDGTGKWLWGSAGVIVLLAGVYLGLHRLKK